MTASYDRQPTETSKAYAGFTIYRNMGVSRSLDRVAAEIYDPETTQKRPRNKSQISAWSHQWNWVERCRDWDKDEELLRRDRQREIDIADHDQKLERYRAQCEGVGFGLMEMGAKFVDLAHLILNPIQTKLREGGRLDPIEMSVFVSLCTAMKSAAAFTAGGSNLAADGLLVRQLMAHLKEGEGGA